MSAEQVVCMWCMPSQLHMGSLVVVGSIVLPGVLYAAAS